MKKLLLLLVLIPFIARGQQVVHFGRNIVAAATSQTAKLGFSSVGDPITSTGWDQYNIENIGTSHSILNTSGSASGWSIINGGANTPSNFSQANGYTDAFFPVDAVTNLWFNSTGSYTLVVSGLDNSKTYSIRIGTGLGGGTRSSFTIGGTTLTMTNNFDDLLFSSVTPTGGAITITVGLVAFNAIINAIIITG